MYELIHSSRTDCDVAFDGELIAEATSNIDLTEYDERTFVLKVYALTGGGFAAVIEFASSNHNIRDILEVEKVDTADDVEMVFAVFEPSEHVSTRTFQASQYDRDRGQMLRRNLLETYLESLDPVVQAVKDYVQSHPGCEYLVTEPKPVATNRILKFFGWV